MGRRRSRSLHRSCAGQVPAGQVCHELASTLDILPTLANLAGCALPQDRVLDGEDITPLLQGNFQAANSEKVFLYYLLSHLQAVVKDHGSYMLQGLGILSGLGGMLSTDIFIPVMTLGW